MRSFPSLPSLIACRHCHRPEAAHVGPNLFCPTGAVEDAAGPTYSPDRDAKPRITKWTPAPFSFWTMPYGSACYVYPSPAEIKHARYGKIEISRPANGCEHPAVPGLSRWVEDCHWYQAPTVDADTFGPHDYEGPPHEMEINGVTRRFAREPGCKCGCWMGDSRSYGPVDPFGPCPANPLLPHQ